MAEERPLLARHQMVWVDPAAWRAMIVGDALPSAPSLVAGWADRGWPLVARSAVRDDEADGMPLGLPLPPAEGKRRLAFRLDRRAVLRSAPPPRLGDAARVAPAHWRATIDALVGLDSGARCFGSLAWQYLTGLPYLSDRSDLDLLWNVGTARGADILCAGIDAVAAGAPMRIDGELVAPSRDAVQWREWHSGAAGVVVKAGGGVRLMPRAEVFP